MPLVSSSRGDDYDVAALLDHIVGWAQVFAAGSAGLAYDGAAAAFRCGDDPAGSFRAAASSLVASWRSYGLDRNVRLTAGEMPGVLVFNMTVMEYMTHGWDLATATGQPIPYTEEEATDLLVRARQTLPPEYRGAGQAFGEIVPVSDGAPAIDRVAGFLGRHPALAGD